MDVNEKAEFLADRIQHAKRFMDVMENKSQTSNNMNNMRGRTEEEIDSIEDQEEVFLTEADLLERMNKTNTQQYPKPSGNNGMPNLNKSKMPAAILQSFRENPIIDPTAPVGMEMLMKEVAKKVTPNIIKENRETTKPSAPTTPTQQFAPVMDTKLIEYIIRKTVEETLEQVTKKSAIDENFEITIGDKKFGGKLSTLKENKINKNAK